MKNLVLFLGMLTLPLGASAQSNQSTSTGVKCSIVVDKTKAVVDPTFFGETRETSCEATSVYVYREGAIHESNIIKTRLLKECALSHIDCTVSHDNLGGRPYPGSEQGAFQANNCVTGTRVKFVALSASEVMIKQCEKIDLCFQDAFNSGDEKLYQMAKDLFSTKKCQ